MTITNNNTISASELVKAKESTDMKKTPFLDVFTNILLNPKDIEAQVRESILEQVGDKDSFIAELDVDNEGNIIATKEVQEYIEIGVEKLTEELTKDILNEAKATNKKYPQVVLATHWTSDNKQVNVKTKYFLDDIGLVMQQMNSHNGIINYTVGRPTLYGLTPLRGEVNYNEELDVDARDTLIQLHNQYALSINGLDPQDYEIFKDLSIQDETNNIKRNFNSNDRKVWIQYYGPFITYIKNELGNEAKPKKRSRVEQLQDSDLF